MNIPEKDRRLRTLRTRLHEHDVRLHESNQRIRKLEKELSEKEMLIEELYSQIAGEKKIIADIHNSWTWRIGQFYGRHVYGRRAHSLVERLLSRLIGK